jgi:hypothetical protein
MFHADRLTEKQTDGQVDGQTDMTKLIVVFRKDANATHKAYGVPENSIYCFPFYGYIISETLDLFSRTSVRRQTVNITAHFFYNSHNLQTWRRCETLFISGNFHTQVFWDVTLCLSAIVYVS